MKCETQSLKNINFNKKFSSFESVAMSSFDDTYTDIWNLKLILIKTNTKLEWSIIQSARPSLETLMQLTTKLPVMIEHSSDIIKQY